MVNLSGCHYEYFITFFPILLCFPSFLHVRVETRSLQTRMKFHFSHQTSKLKNNNYILTEYLNIIKKVRDKVTNCNEVIKIENEIQEIVKQNLALNRLRTKEYIDSAIFIEKNNENNQKIKELMERKRSLVDTEEYDQKIEEVENLINLIETYSISQEFDESLLKLMVKQIVIKDANTMMFILSGGIEITEVAS